MYWVELSQWAQRFLEKLDTHIRDRIEERLKRLAEVPIPSDAKFIAREDKGAKLFRYRIGDFRALYLVQDAEKIRSDYKDRQTPANL